LSPSPFSLASIHFDSSSRPLLFFDAVVSSIHDVRVLLDCGASSNFISSSFVRDLDLKIREVGNSHHVFLPDGRHQICSHSTLVNLQIGSRKFEIDFYVLDIGHDLILGLPWFEKENPVINWSERTLHWRSREFRDVISLSSTESRSEFSLLSAEDFSSEIPQAENVFVTFLTSISEEKNLSSSFSPLLEEFADVFPDDLPPGLPPSRGKDFEIELQPGTKPISKPFRRLSPKELQELKDQIRDLVQKGFIRPSSSPFGAPVLFVKKKDGSFRMCVDYRALNAATIRDVYPLPIIADLLDRLSGAKIFSKLDLRSGYHQLKVANEDVHKTSFRTPIGAFEFLVLPFGLSNAPAAFMRMMDGIFPAYARDYVTTYIDDLLVFSKSEEDHAAHLREVLQTLRENKLYAKKSKCEFGVEEVEFLGHVINSEGVSADPEKLKTVANWPVPVSVAQVQSFMGMVNYFQRFIHKFSEIAAPLTDLLKKKANFVWETPQQNAFNTLKQALITPPVLRLFDPALPTILQTDASGIAVAGVLLQDDGNGCRPVGYVSRKLNGAETRYTVQEKEMLAIMFCLKKWRSYLLGLHFEIKTDHRALEHLKTAKDPTNRVARWFDELSDYHFDIHYEKGSNNQVADALSRVEIAAMASTLELDKEFLDKIRSGYSKDTYYVPIVNALIKKETVDPKFRTRIERFEARDGLIYFRDAENSRLCIPEVKEIRSKLLCEAHDSVVAAHQGIEKTYSALSRRFFWCHMGVSVKRYVNSCLICQRTKSTGASGAGMLQPLPIPSSPWQDISMDFITHLPKSPMGNDSIMVVVDRLSKMAHFLPTTIEVTAEKAARSFVDSIFRLHGMPKSIVSDRDPRFTSDFWKGLFDILGTKLAMSTSAHPETDGQTERTNRTLEQMLRSLVNFHQTDWEEMLPMVEFAFNNSPSSSTGLTPFKTAYGCDPLVPLDLLNPKTVAGKVSDSAKFVKDIAAYIQIARDNLVVAQDSQAEFANSRRSDPSFKVGEQVLLSTEFLTPITEKNRPSAKLRDRFVGPYKVKRVISRTAYELDLPSSIKGHPVIYVKWLKKFNAPDVPERDYRPPPPPVIKKGAQEWEVEDILKSRIHRNSTEYLVQWKGYRDPSWEPERNLTNSKEILRSFLARSL